MARATTADSWDEVWAEYDARHAAAVAMASPAAAAQPVAGTAARPHRGIAGWMAILFVALPFIAYSVLPVMRAVELGAQLGAGNAQALIDQVDWTAVRGGLSQSLRAEASAATAGRAANDPTVRYLMGMADGMADRMATPDGLTRLVQTRLGSDAAAANPWAVARDGLRPTSTTTAELDWAPATAAEGGVTLQLALQEDMKWRVTGIALTHQR